MLQGLMASPDSGSGPPIGAVGFAPLRLQLFCALGFRACESLIYPYFRVLTMPAEKRSVALRI